MFDICESLYQPFNFFSSYISSREDIYISVTPFSDYDDSKMSNIIGELKRLFPKIKINSRTEGHEAVQIVFEQNASGLTKTKILVDNDISEENTSEKIIITLGTSRHDSWRGVFLLLFLYINRKLTLTSGTYTMHYYHLDLIAFRNAQTILMQSRMDLDGSRTIVGYSQEYIDILKNLILKHTNDYVRGAISLVKLPSISGLPIDSDRWQALTKDIGKHARSPIWKREKRQGVELSLGEAAAVYGSIEQDVLLIKSTYLKSPEKAIEDAEKLNVFDKCWKKMKEELFTYPLNALITSLKNACNECIVNVNKKENEIYQSIERAFYWESIIIESNDPEDFFQSIQSKLQKYFDAVIWVSFSKKFLSDLQNQLDNSFLKELTQNKERILITISELKSIIPSTFFNHLLTSESFSNANWSIDPINYIQSNYENHITTIKEIWTAELLQLALFDIQNEDFYDVSSKPQIYLLLSEYFEEQIKSNQLTVGNFNPVIIPIINLAPSLAGVLALSLHTSET